MTDPGSLASIWSPWSSAEEWAADHGGITDTIDEAATLAVLEAACKRLTRQLEGIASVVMQTTLRVNGPGTVVMRPSYLARS